MSIDTSGLDRIQAGLEGAIEAGIDRGAHLIADLARQLAPVDTGALRGSIRVEAGPHALARKVVAGDEQVDYAVFVEYGTHRSPAQPFMTPAAAQIDVQAEVAAEVRKLTGG